MRSTLSGRSLADLAKSIILDITGQNRSCPAILADPVADPVACDAASMAATARSPRTNIPLRTYLEGHVLGSSLTFARRAYELRSGVHTMGKLKAGASEPGRHAMSGIASRQRATPGTCIARDAEVTPGVYALSIPYRRSSRQPMDAPISGHAAPLPPALRVRSFGDPVKSVKIRLSCQSCQNLRIVGHGFCGSTARLFGSCRS